MTIIAVLIGNTKLLAHHVQKKTVKKIMHRRPKKTRPSDVTRSNSNYNIAIEQLPEFQAIPDYTIVSYERKLKITPINYF